MGVIAVAASACSPCGDVHLQYLPSPDKHLAAEVIERHCGKPTDFAQRLVLRAAGWRGWFSDGQEVFALDGPHTIAERWNAQANVLEVWYTGGTVLHQQARWGDVAIVYHGPTITMASTEPVSASAPPPPSAALLSSDTGTWHGGIGRRAFGHGPHKSGP